MQRATVKIRRDPGRTPGQSVEGPAAAGDARSAAPEPLAAVVILAVPDHVGVAAVDARVPPCDHLGAALKDDLPEPLMGLFLEQCDQRHALPGGQVSRQPRLQSLEALRLHVHLRQSGGKLELTLLIRNSCVAASTAK